MAPIVTRTNAGFAAAPTGWAVATSKKTVIAATIALRAGGVLKTRQTDASRPRANPAHSRAHQRAAAKNRHVSLGVRLLAPKITPFSTSPTVKSSRAALKEILSQWCGRTSRVRQAAPLRAGARRNGLSSRSRGGQATLVLANEAS